MLFFVRGGVPGIYPAAFTSNSLSLYYMKFERQKSGLTGN